MASYENDYRILTDAGYCHSEADRIASEAAYDRNTEHLRKLYGTPDMSAAEVRVMNLCKNSSYGNFNPTAGFEVKKLPNGDFDVVRK